MLIDQQRNVPAIPVDAVRSVRELPTVAAALGLVADSVNADIQRQLAVQTAERRARLGAGDDSTGARRSAGRGGSGRDSTRARGARGAWGQGGGRVPGGTRGESAIRQAAGASVAWNPSGSTRAARAQAVFVQTAHGLEPRLVRLGLSDFDYVQVLGGVQEGEQVALLGVAEAQAKRKQDQSRIRDRLGSGVPGSPGVGGAGGGGRGGGGGGR